MLSWVVLIVLAVVLFASYFHGVKQGRPGGRALVVLSAIGILVVVGIKLFTPGPGLGPGQFEGTLPLDQREAARLLGEELKDELPPGSSIFFLGDVALPAMTGWGPAWDMWSKGLTEGLGHDEWESAGYFGPVSGTAIETISAALEEAEEADAILSFAGLPADPEWLGIYRLDNPPLVAVYFRRFYSSAIAPDLGLIRAWLSDGLVQVVVLRESKDQITLYTLQNLPE